MSFHSMTGKRRIAVCVVACALSMTTGCGSLWPFSSSSTPDPTEAKAQAAVAKPDDTAKKPDQDKPAEKAKPKDGEEEKPSPWLFLTPWKWERFHPKPPPGEAEVLVLHGDRLDPDKLPTGRKEAPPEALKDLSGAHELYRLGEYEKAEKIFHRVAEDNGHTPPPMVEEARFYEAECLRRQLRYPRACDTYHRLLLDSAGSTYGQVYKEQALQRVFDIANYWLEDTRKEIAASKEKDGKKSGSGWSILPALHRESTKPYVDEEGRALEALDWVLTNDYTGPLAADCLFLSGSVKFYREDYKDADHFFTQIVEHHANSKYAAQAVELSIVSKHMSTGGADYDGRKVAEARQMIDTALRNYPKLAHEKKDFLIRQLAACTMQQAEKDYKIADFYKRTGHPGSAYFYYEIVRRRYPGTDYAVKASDQMLALRHELEKKQKEIPEPNKRPNDREVAPPPRAAKPSVTPGTPLEETAPAPNRLPPETAPAPRQLPPNMGQ